MIRARRCRRRDCTLRRRSQGRSYQPSRCFKSQRWGTKRPSRQPGAVARLSSRSSYFFLMSSTLSFTASTAPPILSFTDALA